MIDPTKTTILLVEDEVIIAMHTSRILKRFGYNTVTANSGEKAVEMAVTDSNISLILMDINLSGDMDGTEAARQILAVRHLPIVFLTAHMEEDYVTRVREITRYGYVVKNSGDFVLKSSIEMAFELFMQHEKTRASETKYRTYINNAPEGIFVTNDKGQYVDVNPSACKMTGYSREELLGMSITNLGEINEQPADMPSFADLLQSGRMTTERTLKRKDGSRIQVILNAVKISENRFMAYCTDITDRVRMQEELQFQATLLNQIEDLVTATDLKGTINYVNDAVVRMLGKNREELIGKTIYDYGEDSSRGATQQEILDSTLGNETWRGEVVNFDAAGNECILDCRTWVVKNEQARPVALCSVSTDITRRKRLEAERERERIFWQQMMETIPVGITKVDKTGRIVFANEIAEQILGLNINNIQNRTYDDVRWGIVNPDGAPFPMEELPFHIVQQTGEAVFGVEHAIRFPDGTHKLLSVNAAPLYDEQGQFNGIAASIEDITARKRAEDNLRESEERYQFLADATFEAIFVSENGICINQNKTAEKMFGYTIAEATGRPGTQWIHPDYHQLVIHQIISGSTSAYECLAMRQDGSTFWAEVQARMVHQQGRNLRITAVRDISVRKKAEAELTNSRNKLKLANETKDKFFSIIAHELRNPALAFEKGMEILHDHFQGSADGRAREFSQELYKESQKLSELIKNLLEWSRVQRGDISFHPELINLNHVVNNILNLMESGARQKKIELTCQVAAGLEVFADYDMLQAILRSLISNAIKFTKSGGQVTVRARTFENFVEIEVVDNGVGMSAAKLKRLFQVGEKNISTAGTAGETGTGLGLILCQEFVEKHGGKIAAESETGRGSVFRLTLPDNMAGARSPNP